MKEEVQRTMEGVVQKGVAPVVLDYNNRLK